MAGTVCNRRMESNMKKIALILALLFAPLAGHAQTTDLYRVATIAALKALNPTRPPIVAVTDAATGGDFVWGTGACSAADDIFQITPTAGPTGCWTRIGNFYAVGKGTIGIDPTKAPYSAACNGVTNDSTAFTSAFAAGASIVIPRGLTCIVGDLVLAAGKQLDCNGSMLQAVSGSTWVIKKNGVNTWIRNCYVNDPSDYNKKATTLSGAASAGATSVTVTSATGFANGMPVTVLLASGAYWPTKIRPTTGISGTTFTLSDPIPSSATAVAVSGGGGTNCAVGTTMVVQGGSGPPTTLYVSAASAGAVTAATISSPGFYSTAPSNPVTAVSGNNAACTATFNLTMAGASSGAAFEGTWGSLIVDQSSYGGLSNITMPSVYGGIAYYSTSTSSANPTTQEKVDGVQINAARHFGMVVDAGVYVSFFRNILIYGNGHGSSNYGTVGFYRNYVHPTNGSPSGGNHFDYITLTFETGTLCTYGNLDTYGDNPTNDTIRNYAFIGNGCYKNSFVGPAFNAFTGPAAYSGTGGLGIGTYFGKYTVTSGSAVAAVDNILSSGITGGSNAGDLYCSDHAADGTGSGAAIWLGPSGPNPILSGQTACIQNARTVFSGGSGATVGGLGSTWYLANGLGASTTENIVSTLVATTGSITKFSCQSDIAPGVGNTHTCAFRDFPTPNAGVSTTRASCSYTGAATYGCNYTGPGFYIATDDQVAIQITSSASAPAAVFKVYAAGL